MKYYTASAADGIIGLLFVAFIIWLFVFAIRKLRKKSKPSQKIPMPTREMTVPASASKPKIELAFDVVIPNPFEYKGPKPNAVKAGDDQWAVFANEKNVFTLYKPDEGSVNELLGIFANNKYGNDYETRSKLSSAVSKTNVRCKEIDEYVQKINDSFNVQLQDMTGKPEYQNSTELDKEAMEDELWNEFYENIDEELSGTNEDEFLRLLHEGDCDRTGLKALSQKYSYDAIRYHVGRPIGAIIHAAAGSWDRLPMELLVVQGLARIGSEIEPKDFVDALTLKQMNEVAGAIDKPFTRKQKASEFLEGLPDLKDRLGKIIAFREFFQILPVSTDFSGIDFKKVSIALSYDSALANCLAAGFQWGLFRKKYKRNELPGDIVNDETVKIPV